MLRLITNKAKQHFNNAVEQAERQQYHGALAELNNALELDSRLLEALVLKGTILARMERFEEAKETWNRAITLNPQAARAHRYLGQVGDARAAVPLLRRARLVVYGAATVAAVAVIAAVGTIMVTSDVDAHQIRRGWTALQEGDYDTSREVAAKLDDPAARVELLSAVNTSIQEKLDNAFAYAVAGDVEEAASALDEVSKLSLPNDLEEQYERKRATIARYLLSSVEQNIDTSKLTQESLEQIASEISQLEESFPQIQDDTDAIRTSLASTVRDRILNRLEPLLPFIEDPAETEVIVQALENSRTIERSFLNIFPDSGYTSATAPFEKAFSEILLKRARLAAADARPALYKDSVSALEALLSDNAPELREAHELNELLRENQLVALRKEIQSALQEGRLHEAVEAADQLADAGIAPDDEMAIRIAEARSALSANSYYELMDMADAIESDLDEETARRVLVLADRAESHLPGRIRLRAEENLLYFRALANARLDEREESKEAWEKLTEKYPRSPYLGRRPDSAL